VAGGFGRHLNLKNAAAIGLLPNLPEDTFQYLGNTSLAGAYKVLISEKYRKKQAELAAKITYIDLGGEPSYMDEYTAALFLPHTDTEMFGGGSHGDV
jgi:uncharacterized 2Fe-2S/4Fe-4S cluster protein (DUF4445 family)